MEAPGTRGMGFCSSPVVLLVLLLKQLQASRDHHPLYLSQCTLLQQRHSQLLKFDVLVAEVFFNKLEWV